MALTIAGRAPQDLLDELCKKHKVVGATLGILKDGDVTTAASGILNTDTGVETTADSVFQIGSIGKVFTTTLVMQLVDKGLVNLDDKVVDHLPDFRIADKVAMAQITVEQLLNHTSGIDGDFFPPDSRHLGANVESYVTKMAQLGQLAAPGEFLTYCNAALVVAGLIIEKRTGKTWADCVVDNILKPLNITHGFAHPQEALRYRCAMGHMALDPEQPGVDVPASQTFICLSSGPAGAVISMDVAGLLKFAQVHMNNGLIEKTADGEKRLLSEESAIAMRTATKALEPCPFRSGLSHWGLGWFLSLGDDYEVVGHDGGTIGHLTFLRTVPKQKFAFTLFTNCMGGVALMDELEALVMDEHAGIVFPTPSEEEVEPAQPLGNYAGTYLGIAGNQSYHVRDGALVLRMKDMLYGGPDREVGLKPVGENLFKMTGEGPSEKGFILFQKQDTYGKFIYARTNIRMLKRQGSLPVNEASGGIGEM